MAKSPVNKTRPPQPAGTAAREAPAKPRPKKPTPKREADVTARAAGAEAPRKLLLLDGHSLAYRAFYALPTDLATPEGTVTNAVFGFTSMLVKLLGDEHPDHIVVAFDAPGGTFRDSIGLDQGVEYKANRKETPDLFRPQLPLIREVLEALEIPTLEIEGVEADDVIATLAGNAADAGMDTIIVTGDRDTYQLVRDPHIKVLYNRRGVSDYVLYDEAGIHDRCGVRPDQYVELAALRGDNSDNLPGVPGVGDKTAAKLVNQYGSLEGIFDHLDEMTPKLRENLMEWQDRAMTNREMMLLRRNVDIGLSPDELRQGHWDREKVRTLFNQLAFRTLWDRLIEAVGPDGTGVGEVEPGESVDVDVRIAPNDAPELLAAVAAGSERYAIAHHALGMAVASGDTYLFLPNAVLDASGKGAATRRAFDALLASDAPLVTHGAKELIHALDEVELAALVVDTELAAYLVDPGSGRYEIEDLAERHLGLTLEPGTTIGGAKQGTLNLEGADDEADAAALTARRAEVTLRLALHLEEVMDNRELTPLYCDIERPLVPVLAAMERAGIAVDLDFLEELRTDLAKECDRLVSRIHAAAGEPFNVNSTKQLREILFERLELTPVKKTPKGEPSTDADSLEKMREGHPMIEDLLRYREVEKLRSTYADALPPLVADDGRIHTTFKQTATTTGRISSEAPNLQNIPLRSAEGRQMRKAFVAEPGNVLLSADYSQIELRILAHLADDPGLIDAFERDADVHTTTAAAVFGVDEEQVNDFQRRFAKVVNYGLAYGMEAFGLAQRLDIPTEEARAILDAYFESFPNVAAFMDGTIRSARKLGYTTTLFGRRRMLPELASDNFRIRQMGERMAQNAPVQGSAADIFKIAMIRLHAAIRSRSLATQMILTVHDELVFEVPERELDEVVALVREVMEGAASLRVPLKVDAHTGPTWADAKG